MSERFQIALSCDFESEDSRRTFLAVSPSMKPFLGLRERNLER